MRGTGTVSTTVTPSLMDTKMLNEADLEAINAKYSLDLDYGNATHYRAAQVIWSISRATPSPAAVPAGDSPEAAQAPSDTSSSYPETSADTAD